MSYFPEIYQEWCRDVIGKKLFEVNGLIYVLDAPDLDRPQRLQFIFSGINQEVNIRCGKDGATLELSKLPMQESDLGEYGKELIMSMSSSRLFQRYIGRKVSGVFPIYSDAEKTIIGIKLVFDGELSLIIINFGDEINIFDSLPSLYEQEEGINYLDISA